MQLSRLDAIMTASMMQRLAGFSHCASGSINSMTPSTSPLLYLCSTSACHQIQFLQHFACHDSYLRQLGARADSRNSSFGAYIVVLKYDILSLEASAFSFGRHICACLRSHMICIASE